MTASGDGCDVREMVGVASEGQYLREAAEVKGDWTNATVGKWC